MGGGHPQTVNSVDLWHRLPNASRRASGQFPDVIAPGYGPITLAEWKAAFLPGGIRLSAIRVVNRSPVSAIPLGSIEGLFSRFED